MADTGNSYTKLARSAADLCAFMMVCRHGQLSAAAREMKLSQPSLSQRIRNLETALDQQLFERGPKGVTLTRDGQALYRKLHRPLTELAEQFWEVSNSKRPDRLLIAVDFAFAYFWLLPRLPAIREKLGDVDVCVLTSQEPSVDLVSGTDLIIQMGEAGQALADATWLIKEKVSVVCSPAFKDLHPELRTPGDLKDAKAYLLHLNAPSRTTHWCNWEEWLNAWGVDTAGLGKGTVFNNYEMIVQATVRGQGIALGWQGLVDDLMRSNALTELMPQVFETERGYYMSHAKATPSRSAIELHNWIAREIAL
ncbi:LysR family transcriptional regulator [Tritonibacter multivorans]|nr:LysR family transcriptional regulator [Tritonibacter multivorans]MDA7421919.1 LysR family transcriptional regulator [Tritonibacter multivorans]